MSRYLWIVALQEPFMFNVDEHERPMLAVNFATEVAGVATQFEEEIVKVLSDAGVATLGTDTWIGSQAVVPSGDGPFTEVITTGGTPPDETHNGSEYTHPSVQIVVRAVKYRDARTRALAIRQALQGVRNATVTV